MKIKAFLPSCMAVVLSAMLMSCADDAAINTVMGGNAEAPAFIAYRSISGTEIAFQFSVPVKVVDVHLDKEVEFEAFPEDYDPVIVLKFLSECAGGESITASFLVEDADGNTLDLLVPFKTRNRRVPKLLFNEIRLNYNNPSVEFIEILAKSGGNMGAIRLFAAGTSTEDAVYEFPPVEVKDGEYITLHLRTLDPTIEVDELDDELGKSGASKGPDANNEARDLWVPGAEKILHTADVIYMLDQDDNIIDALLIAKDASDWSKNKKLSEAAEFVAKQGAWLNKGGETVTTVDYTDIVSSNGATLTRTLCRDEAVEDSNTLKDWYICDTSKASPGKKNSDKRYIPKSAADKSVSKSRSRR
jgi:hypothetical protein